MTSVLVRPGAADFALAADEDRAGIGVDEQLRHIGFGEPGRIVLDHLHDIGRLALDRDLARPGERRAAALAGLKERPAVFGHLFVGELAQHRAGQHALDEHVLGEDHVLAALGAESLKGAARILGPVGPGDRRDQRLHVDDAGDALRVAARPFEAERRAPVVDHEDDAVAERELIPQREQILALLRVGVALRA